MVRLESHENTASQTHTAPTSPLPNGLTDFYQTDSRYNGLRLTLAVSRIIVIKYPSAANKALIVDYFDQGDTLPKIHVSMEFAPGVKEEVKIYIIPNIRSCSPIN